MAREPDNGLHALIHSLSRSEKRYFKLTASPQGGEPNYIRLFDAIERQKEYDEAALKETFAGENFIRQFHVTKRYLYNLIVKSMRAYHADATVSGRLRNLLQDAEFLAGKGLEQELERTIERGIGLARTYQKIPLLLEFLQLRRRQGTLSMDEVEELQRERLALLQRADQRYRYDHLQIRIDRMVIGRGLLRDAEDLQRLDALMENPLLGDVSHTETFGAEATFYHIHSSCHFARGEFREALRYLQYQAELFERSPPLMTEHFGDYLVLLNNILVLQGQLENDNDFMETLRKLRGAPIPASGTEERKLQGRIFNFACGLEFSFHLERGGYEHCLKMIPEIEQGLAEHGEYLNETQIARYHYLIAYLHMILGDYRTAMERLGRLSLQRGTSVRQFIPDTAGIMLLILYYELGETDLLESAIRSTYRHLRRRERLYGVERVLLKYLRKLPGIADRDELRQTLREFRNELLPFEEDRHEAVIFYYFDYPAWLEARTEGRPFAETLREHFAARRERGMQR